MNVSSYLFQSPYPGQVQVGRPDPSVKKEEVSTQGGAESSVTTNQAVQEAQNFQATQVSEVEPTVESEQLLDIYV